jgi:predicted ATPase/DNA-binding SARP family transcriptional activator
MHGMTSGQPDAAIHVTYSQQFRRCNKPACPTCVLGAPGHGPYWYAYWREGGRRRSRYIGKQRPLEAASAPVAEPDEGTSDQVYAPLRVRTLGGFAVWCGTKLLPADAWTQRKAALLFKCLVSAPRHRLHREQLSELLRPEEEPTAAAAYLRVTVHRLRQVLGERAGTQGYVRVEGDLLALVPAPAGAPSEDWLDANAFERAAAPALAGGDAGACRTALALYGGAYLPDDLYDEWAVMRREELSQQYLALLLRLADLRERDGVLGEAARCLRSVLAVDPCHEPAARSLMRVQVAAGRALEAVRTYKQLVEALRRDLDMVPEKDTEDQYRAALASRQASTASHFNLPTLFTSFLGREQELATLARLLAGDAPSTAGRACRLLTVTGSGGCGKTRLAIELGHELRHAYPDGLWLVELASLAPDSTADPEPLARHTADMLELRADPGHSALATLIAALQSHSMLLILDNCEHVVAGCASFVASLLHSCPELRILATSREALGVLGEHVWRLPSLAVAARPGRAGLSLHEVGRHAATRLLVERARLVRPDFAVTLDNCRAVVEICQQLDGIPLAIELAAARLGQLSTADLAARLDDRFRLLTAGNRTALPRHQTLRAVLDWSYGLLSADEQALLRILSVFAGGWTLDAVEAVCSGSPLQAASVSDLLARLASKSLVQVEDTPETPSRYRLLETVRHYAAQQLREQGEETPAREQHMRWCVALVERVGPALYGPDRRVSISLLETEHDNLRLALGWCTREAGDLDAALRLSAGLWWFWAARGHWIEGRTWLSTVLSREGGTPAVRLRALRGLGHFAINQGEHVQARAVHEECLALGRATHDSDAVANALNGLGNVARFVGDLAKAAALYEDSLAIFQREGDRPNIVRALHNLALVAQEEGDYSRAIALGEECMMQRRGLDDARVFCPARQTLLNQAVCYRLAGNLPRAATMLESLQPRFDEMGDIAGGASVHNELGRVACEQRQYQQAVAHLLAGLNAYRSLGERAAQIDVLENWAVAVAGQGNPALAVRLLGAVDAAYAQIGHPIPPGSKAVFASDVALARRLLCADDIFAATWAEGQSVTLDDIVAEVLALGPSGSVG